MSVQLREHLYIYDKVHKSEGVGLNFHGIAVVVVDVVDAAEFVAVVVVDVVDAYEQMQLMQADA